MITQEAPKRLKAQACPLCGQEQDIIINGHYPYAPDPSKVQFDPDKGYSFCNCRNIFFTDWSNMDQGEYNAEYEAKYNNEHVRNLLIRYAEEYFGEIIPRVKGRVFYEIGAVAPFLLTQAKKRGFKTYALDIIDHKFDGHVNITGDFEDPKTVEGHPRPDVIWASHVFEHFKNPIAMARRCFEIMQPGGVMFVAMPDPYLMDLKSPQLWGHWHLKEHHILWDMQSFCEMMEEQGFKTVLKVRNAGYRFICIGDYHLIFQKD